MEVNGRSLLLKDRLQLISTPSIFKTILSSKQSRKLCCYSEYCKMKIKSCINWKKKIDFINWKLNHFPISGYLNYSLAFQKVSTFLPISISDTPDIFFLFLDYCVQSLMQYAAPIDNGINIKLQYVIFSFILQVLFRKATIHWYPTKETNAICLFVDILNEFPWQLIAQISPTYPQRQLYETPDRNPTKEAPNKFFDKYRQMLYIIEPIITRKKTKQPAIRRENLSFINPDKQPPITLPRPKNMRAIDILMSLFSCQAGFDKRWDKELETKPPRRPAIKEQGITQATFLQYPIKYTIQDKKETLGASFSIYSAI